MAQPHEVSVDEFREMVLKAAPSWTTDTLMLVELCHVLVLAVWKMKPVRQPAADNPEYDYWKLLYIKVISGLY